MNGMDRETLAAEYARRRSPELRDAATEAYLPAARSVARRFAGRGVEEDDLFQVASLAMVKALERFDPEKGVRFISFAVPSMVGEVRNYFRDSARLIRLPRRGVQLSVQAAKARSELEQELGRSPRADELAERLQASLDDVLQALEISGHRMLSLDSGSDAEEEAPLESFLGEMDASMEAFERDEQIQSAMNALDERQREVIRLRFFEGLSQRQAAERLGLSQMTVSRIERQALDALKKKL